MFAGSTPAGGTIYNREIVYRDIAVAKRKQAEKYEGRPEYRLLQAQADYFETMAAAQESEVSAAERDQFRLDILAEVDEKIHGLVAQWKRQRVQNSPSGGSTPPKATIDGPKGPEYTMIRKDGRAR